MSTGYTDKEIVDRKPKTIVRRRMRIRVMMINNRGEFINATVKK
jgi:hypothetical protein